MRDNIVVIALVIALVIVIAICLLSFGLSLFGRSQVTISEDIFQYREYYAQCFEIAEDELMCANLAAEYAKKY